MVLYIFICIKFINEKIIRDYILNILNNQFVYYNDLVFRKRQNLWYCLKDGEQGCGLMRKFICLRNKICV